MLDQIKLTELLVNIVELQDPGDGPQGNLGVPAGLQSDPADDGAIRRARRLFAAPDQLFQNNNTNCVLARGQTLLQAVGRVSEDRAGSDPGGKRLPRV